MSRQKMGSLQTPGCLCNLPVLTVIIVVVILSRPETVLAVPHYEHAMMSRSSNRLYTSAVADGRFASFVFGDSIVDGGNNFYLRRSLATANSLPNGIDFPSPNAAHPTGRFTNGLTIPDIIGKELGSPSFAPPVLAPSTKGAALLNGVNYASGGAGIFNDTGKILFRELIPMDEQVSYFEGSVGELRQVLGGVEATQRFLGRAVFSVTMGSNDFLGNYLFPLPTSQETTLPSQVFIQTLIDKFKSQLTRLYEIGARNIVVVNVPIIGCTPFMRSLNVGSNGNCSAKANELAMAYNAQLKAMVNLLNQQLHGAAFLYADAYGITSHILQNYEAYGFVNVDKACCGLAGSEKGIVPCRYPFVPMCPDRNRYFFWDPYHPSQHACTIVASEFLDGTDFISPINIRQLFSAL